MDETSVLLGGLLGKRVGGIAVRKPSLGMFS